MAAVNGLPEGWTYEPADPSVGIFGEAFYHEDCDQPADGDAMQDWVASDELRITCTGCGAVVTLEAPEPEPWYED
jgi:hypothetical protein